MAFFGYCIPSGGFAKCKSVIHHQSENLLPRNNMKLRSSETLVSIHDIIRKCISSAEIVCNIDAAAGPDGVVNLPKPDKDATFIQDDIKLDIVHSFPNLILQCHNDSEEVQVRPFSVLFAYVFFSNVTVKDCKGGFITIYDGYIRFNNSIFVNNGNENINGGIFELPELENAPSGDRYRSVEISNCTFDSNLGNMGSVLSSIGTVSFRASDSFFVNGTALNSGGVFDFRSGQLEWFSTFTFLSCTFDSNRGTHGGVFSVNSNDSVEIVSIDNSFNNNHAKRNGGVFSILQTSNERKSSFKLTNNSFTKNDCY